MLAETYRLLNALRDAEIPVSAKNPRVHEPGRTAGTCIRVRLKANGEVAGTELLTDDEVPGLWTVREGNHNSFPVVRSKLDTSSEATLWARLRDVKARELEEVTAGKPELATVHAMVSRFRAGAAELPTFVAQIVAALPQLSDKQAAGKLQLAFDVDGAGTIYRTAVRRAVEWVLPPAIAGGATNNNGISSLSGRDGALQTRAFPQVRLPVLNKDFALVSMFSEARCNVRYGLTDSAIVPVLEDEALALQDALVHMTAPEREGRTWTAVASGQFDGRYEKSDLLISFVEGKPEIAAQVAAFFGDTPDDVQWEVHASAVCQALKGVAHERPRSRLNLFIIRAVSLGQAQVVLAEAPTVEDVLAGAEWWQEAARNLPALSVPMPGEKGQPARAKGPASMAPAQLVRVLSRQWITSGTDSRPVAAPGLGVVLEVMLRSPGKRDASAMHLLELAVERTTPLLLGLFGALHTAVTERWTTYPARVRSTALQAASALGILLSGLGRPKEEFMQSQPFLIGRLLSLADTLHREYCVHVRGGGIPPQLLGNALMPVAAQSPADALDRLGGRIPIYQAWARQGKRDETGAPVSKLAIWALGEMGAIAAEVGTPLTTMQTVDRAELLLGYLARPSTSNQPEDETSDN